MGVVIDRNYWCGGEHQRFGALELRRDELLACAGWDGGHEDMERALCSGRIAGAHVDPRGLEERVQGWLRAAQELDVVRLRA